MVKRTPNRLKFDITMSDLSRLDGTMICDDDQWNAIFLILIGADRPLVAGPGARLTDKLAETRMDAGFAPGASVEHDHSEGGHHD